MNTLVLIVGDYDEETNTLPVDILPNDALDAKTVLTALRVAEARAINVLVADAVQGALASLEEKEESADTVPE